MSVHYKFKSALEYDTVTFDGLHISVKDLKNAIIQQKRIGRSTDFDLQVTNAQTKEVYEDEDTLIPKNTSLLIARIPLAAQTKSKTWEGYGGDSTPPTRVDEVGSIAKAVDLANLDASEDDKIRAMISQSTQDYDPSNYVKIRGANQMGAVPPNYRCYKCHQSGHWIKDCPLSQGPEPMEIKKSTGIPRSFMVPVDSPQVPGAMMTPNGQYAVPVLDHLAYTQKQQPPPPVQEPKPEIPEDLLCSICSDLLTDAVMIPCCGNSFCDECIRSCLLESEEHECPDCHEKDISPGTLIPNRYLRNSVLNFKNNTGYTKRLTEKPSAAITQPATSTTQAQKPVEEKRPATPVSPKTIKPESPKEVCKPDSGEKTVISEADSTEPPKKGAGVDFSQDIDINKEETKIKEKELPATVPEGPPGVSPRESPKPQQITSNLPPRQQTSSRHGHRRSHDRSPRRPHHRSARSPQYREPSSRNEDRAGTPTIDEPGMGVNIVAPNNVYTGPTPPYTAAPPTGSIPQIMGLPQPPVLQGAPPMSGPYTGQPPPGVFPPTQGPPPNFRLPPPNQYSMPVGPYNVPPRPVFDPSRPPVGGPVPPYQSAYSGHRSSRNRDYSGRGMRGRTPPGIIDDPLEAFNRMLREKDERERRAKQQRKGRSYSRSSSRSFSRSPVRRMRSRSPRRRNSRSRSRSFSMSRSRSRSFSPGGKGSPTYRGDRDFSPRGSPRRRAHSRYRSPPVRSPPRYRYKDGGHNERGRDFERDRDFHRDRGFSRERDFRDRERDGNNTDYHYYGNNDGYNKQDNRGRNKTSHWGQGAMHREGYYPPAQQQQQQQQDMQVPPPYRFPPREGYNVPPPPYVPKNEMPPMHRRYDDVAPPGTEQPPVPGMEPSPQPEEKYQYSSPNREFREKEVSSRHEKEDRKDRHHRYSRSPEKVASSSRKSKDRERNKDRHESPDKHKRKRREDDESDKDKHKHKKDSDDDKLKKLKEKKRKKDKRDADKKKRKEKKEKREKKEDKDKKVKEEVKKVKSSVEEPPKQEVSGTVEKDKVKSEPEEKKKMPEEQVEETKADLYGDIITEGIDTKVVESYGKIEDTDEPKSPQVDEPEPHKEEIESSKEYDDSEKDILELHTSEADLKTDVDKSEVLAPVPEKSKWEMDEDILKSPKTPDSSKDYKTDKSGKVTNEVLKRAENAIFAKAINAIRPIEIKKISTDRAKLYSSDRERKNSEEFSAGHSIQVTIASKCENATRHPGAEPAKCVEVPAEKPRLSVKERLGVKVEDLDRIVKVDRTYDRNRSCSLSPLSKRASELGGVYPMMERRVEVEEKRRTDDRGSRSNRDGRYNRNFRSSDRSDSKRDHRDSRRDRERDVRRRDDEPVKKDDHRERRDKSPNRHRTRRDSEARKEKRKRSRTRSESADRKDKKRKKDKKQKKEKSKRHHKKEDDEKKDTTSKTEKLEEQTKPKAATDRRKPTLDEASFEPDYDLETESEKEDEKPKEIEKRSSSSGSESDKKDAKKKESSSSDSSDSSSEEDRKKKKHKKHKKKRSRKDSSSSSSESESESSDDEKERKKKRHKKKQKKRKKSKHK